MNDEIKELEKDFKEALEHVDFMEYSPYSKEYMKALFIGQMWDLLCKLNETNHDSDIEEELDGAKTYLELYKTTGEVDYKTMASDELRHAGILIKKHLAKTSAQAEKDVLNKMESERQKMLSQINTTLATVQSV